MSGTLGIIRKQKEEQEKARKKILAESIKQKNLSLNREKIVSEICKTFGWTQLDDFAKKMIDEAFNGQMVDIKKLKKDLFDWKTKKEQEASSSQEQL